MYMKEFSNLWQAIGFRYVVILIFAGILWLIFQFVFEEITKIHMGIAAIIAIILSPRMKTIKNQDETVYQMKWWGFKFLKI
ncbi:hypothetical protein GCM10010832_08530 [Psychroflexus planctonicus]|uniref:Uncharacterized protein n=2 Tax=Psychroflexus planctonicus TaxID=1526575 RepID=A0ABQ1SFY6_9FLAO|nr:hypothetical protein GCM10010832_08530 [Psychroflexus planctonicus]